MLTALWRGFINQLDTENVKLYVWPYYLTLFFFGVIATILHGRNGVPTTYVASVMGPLFYTIWTWQLILGTSEVMVGLVIPWKYFGLWLQLGGNFGMSLALLAYEIAAFTIWGPAAFSFFAIAPYVLGCLFLSATVVRKLYLIHHIAREYDLEGEPRGRV